jgi:hypothetical protein
MWSICLGALTLAAGIVLVYTAATANDVPGSGDPMPKTEVRGRHP